MPASRQQRSQWTTATTALKNLGFRELDVRKAIGVLQEKHVDAPTELEALIREALLLLT